MMHTVLVVDAIVTISICVTVNICVGISVGSNGLLWFVLYVLYRLLLHCNKPRMSQVLLPSHSLNVFLVARVLDGLAANYRLGCIDCMTNAGVGHRANFRNLIC